MLDKYEDLNLSAKDYLIDELDKIYYEKYNEEAILKRCHNEINLFDEKGYLFIIEILHKFKKENKNIYYHFRGMINNSLLLYVLGLSKVNPLEYNLPYELITDRTINVDLVGIDVVSLVDFISKNYYDKLRIVAGSYEKCEIEERNQLEENHYLFIPTLYEEKKDITFRLNINNIFETVENYGNFTNDYISVRFGEKYYLFDYDKVDIENVLNIDFEKDIASILKPKTISDYIKVKSVGHGTSVWRNNQEYLVKEEKININNLIATREDILEYLLDHSIDKEMALEILNYIYRNKWNNYPNLWDKYVKIMKEHNCEDIFIDIFSKIEFIFGRGQAVSECLFVLDKENYIECN